WIGPALHELFERAAAIEPRARAPAVPAFANPVGFVGGADASLEIGKLHFFPQPVDDVVDLQLEQELNLAVVLSAGTLLPGATLATRVLKHVPGLGFAL